MNIFIKAGVLTLIVLLVGVQIGMWIESSKLEDIRSSLDKTDVLFNDARLQSIYYQSLQNNNNSNFCNSALEANLKYNDMIYRKGIEIENYEMSGKFTPNILLDREKYALLQFQFWMNAMQLKKICGFDYHVLLHLWKYDAGDYNTEVQQKLQSAVLIELKEKCGPKIMLSNTPIDFNLTSVELVVANYNITETPSVLIDGNITLKGFRNLEQLSYYINCTG